jgi:hypothetical protein
VTHVFATISYLIDHWEQVVSISALVLSIGGILYAVRLDRHMFRMVGEFGRQTDRLTKLSDRLAEALEKTSTKYRGEFPVYLKKLVELIDSAETRILICSTIPLQGFFSRPDHYRALEYALRQKIHGEHPVPVTAVFSKEHVQRVYLEEQFKRAIDEWDVWKDEQDNWQKLTRFAEWHKIELEQLNGPRFLDLMVECGSKDLQWLQETKAAVIPSDNRHYLNIWVVDDKAIFAFPVTRPQFANHAFSTEDPTLSPLC